MQMEKTLKIKIISGLPGVEFPYGFRCGPSGVEEANRQFICESIDQIFSAKQHNMNFYELDNGMFVHVYNACEVLDVNEETLPPLYYQIFLTAHIDGKAILKGERLYSNFHEKFFEAQGAWVDNDGDVYIYFDSGNVKLTSIIRAEEAEKFVTK